MEEYGQGNQLERLDLVHSSLDFDSDTNLDTVHRGIFFPRSAVGIAPVILDHRGSSFSDVLDS